jgi:AbrB family looped-hinge helix DNA binding protein
VKIAESRLTRQGQVSIPAEVRRRLGLQPGSVVEWDAEGDEIVVRRAGRYTSQAVHDALFALEPDRHTLDELKEGIKRHVRAKHARG